MKDPYDTQDRNAKGRHRCGMQQRYAWFGAGLIVVAHFGSSQVCASPQQPTHASRETIRLAPLIVRGQIIKDEYIVVTDSLGVPNSDQKSAFMASRYRGAVVASEMAELVATANRGDVFTQFRTALVGFSARLDADALAKVRASPGVLWVQANRVIPFDRGSSEALPVSIAPVSLPKGLDRIDERTRSLDGKFETEQTSNGVHVYVVDTGISTHSDFEDRVRNKPHQSADWLNATNDHYGPMDECVDHGTRVASIIGGKELGVAKHIILHPVRVIKCGGYGTTTMLADGLNWVVDHYLRNKRMGREFPAVINISVIDREADPDFEAVDAAVNTAINEGVTVVVGAGNTHPDGIDACAASPGRVPRAITVGNIDPDGDMRVRNSDIGTCLDLFAPGYDIDTATNYGSLGSSSGTSFAAPHVAGVAALFLGRKPSATPAEVWRVIYCTANVYNWTPGWPGIPNPGNGSPNRLLHWGKGASNGTLMNAQIPPLESMRSCAIAR